jgi:hypothetical protein
MIMREHSQSLPFFIFLVKDSGLGTKGTTQHLGQNFGQIGDKLYKKSDKPECRDILLYIKNINVHVVVVEKEST